MFEVNDALAHQIIRSAHEPNEVNRGAFQTTMHPLSLQSPRGLSLPTPATIIATLAAGIRHDIDWLAALVAPRPMAEEACCPAMV